MMLSVSESREVSPAEDDIVPKNWWWENKIRQSYKNHTVPVHCLLIMKMTKIFYLKHFDTLRQEFKLRIKGGGGGIPD